ncbi:MULTISPECIES: acyl-CoA thioesterase [unclassified Novosphingobium]|uniref:acyl-CoA thioesterase n=1 Tax=unclassified Novosphingobium TaxID=2644732 RepID=UPI000868FD24|nr:MULTISPECIES: thioesterase family protein [unclassified Novosphingobium]MBN9145493.1 acyl-CoA thioesterase [Novosphingobium sp.]MDR6709766.1 4-hydroxybenzoyl-CoA thioesterase [Novosphingobium sp. 1748]ODU83057.1 MAG: thioesterase [Novosphingobium sp. SCN 63-17]OJX88202.1 MAG: thioesterase [Novosphingobium sp. 63-713]
MPFNLTLPVRFADVDPAGIVFYPRYFEMLNALVEDWFASLGFPFKLIHMEGKMGVPTVRLEVDFIAPSELGESLDLSLEITKLGKSSCQLAISFACEGQVRLKALVVLVCMDLGARQSMPWPETLRDGMQAYLV